MGVYVIHILFLLGVGYLAYAYTQERTGRENAQRAYDVARQRADYFQANEQGFRDLFTAEMRRVNRLTAQNMRLAQQLATLRVQNSAAPDELDVPDDPPSPYSEELEEFLSNIENVEALEVVEGEVEAMRESGLSDSEILARISRGD